MFSGPPVTVKEYHPSLLKVLNEQPDAIGVSCVESLIVPATQAPFIVSGVAVEQVVPCAIKSFEKNTKTNSTQQILMCLKKD